MPVLALALVLLMNSVSSDDESDEHAIARAQAEARAASIIGGPSDTACNLDAPFAAPDAQEVPARVTVPARRKTCVKDKLSIMCGRCSRRPNDRRPCSYKTGEWDPQGSSAQPPTAEPLETETRTRRQPSLTA